jgi:membrane fusion protein (multidrug efflux system)
MPRTRRRYQLLSVICLLSTIWLSACQQEDPNAAKKAPPKEAEVGVMRLQPQDVVLTNELPGRVVAVQTAEVRPQVNGIIQAQLFEAGSEVRKGTPLYQIDNSTYQVALETAQAQLAKAQANLETAITKNRRNQALVERGLISRDSYDDQATEVKQGQADVEVAKAAIKTAKINLAYSTIKAPITGYVGKSVVTPGSLVTANQATALATMQSLDPIWVDITLASTDFVSGKNAITPQVSLLLPNGAAYSQTGHLAFTDTSVDKATGALTMRAEFDNPQRQLLPGMFVRARLETGEQKAALLVPQQAVSRKANGEASVWLLNSSDSTVNPKSVKTGQAITNQWLISEGLSAGDQIVVDGFQKIKPGAKVKPLPLGVDGKPLKTEASAKPPAPEAVDVKVSVPATSSTPPASTSPK